MVVLCGFGFGSGLKNRKAGLNRKKPLNKINNLAGGFSESVPKPKNINIRLIIENDN
jgi:hypothetical protein